MKNSPHEQLRRLTPSDSAADGLVEGPVEIQADAMRRKRGRGHPSKLTPRVAKVICDSIREGNYKWVSAKKAGICKETLINWCNRGAEGEQPYANFLANVEQAEIECEEALVRKFHGIAVRSDDDHRPIRDFLNLRFRERWGREPAQPDDGGSVFQITIHVGGDDSPTVVQFPIKSPVEKFTVPKLEPPENQQSGNGAV